MNGMTLFFVLLGVAVVTANLMRFVEWLDTPHTAQRRVDRPAAAERDSATAFPRAELALESALYAA